MFNNSHKVKRITILYSKASGHSLACWKELKARYNIELQVFHWKVSQDAPFELNDLDWIDHIHMRENYNAQQMIKLVQDFAPQGIYISGWMDRGYLEVAKAMKRKGTLIVSGLDGQWRGSVRQRLGCLTSSVYIHPAIDILWVAGERQAQFAKRLGYSGAKCWHGLYCCDWEKFSASGAESSVERAKAFFYVGRYVVEKGIEELLTAYRVYRSQVENPWQLVCAGAGSMKNSFYGQEGLVDIGFIQPNELPDSLRGKASAFVLPSRKEPWGVVLQEAAASGLPLICSDACGASVHLLQNGYNGFLFESGNAEHLAACMVKLHQASLSERLDMGRRSYDLSKQFTPQRWAMTFVRGIEDRLVNDES